PTPMKAPGLISARLALTTPYTAALSVSFTFTSPASPALTVSVEPSTASIGPRRRTVCGCCADADEVASAATTAAPPSRRRGVLPLLFLRKWLGGSPPAAPASRRRVVLPMLFLRKWLRAVTSGRHAQDKTGRSSWTYMGGVMP